MDAGSAAVRAWSHGRQATRLLWAAGRALTVGVALWVRAGAVTPAVVVAALGAVVGDVADAVRDGFGAVDVQRIAIALVLAGIAYAFLPVLDPVGAALGTAARSRITGSMQARLLRAVSGPTGIGHLEDPAVLDRLASAEGSLTGVFPGDAPV
ncbi:hypothetical protein [Pseudonocardia sp. GCM10023141]|uniref:hypothetical protein n=1 Tax=Pseudonocardia sp. GCM10023141 TaxID=3252653 RepID=UPI003612DB0D